MPDISGLYFHFSNIGVLRNAKDFITLSSTSNAKLTWIPTWAILVLLKKKIVSGLCSEDSVTVRPLSP